MFRGVVVPKKKQQHCCEHTNVKECVHVEKRLAADSCVRTKLDMFGNNVAVARLFATIGKTTCYRYRPILNHQRVVLAGYWFRPCAFLRPESIFKLRCSFRSIKNSVLQSVY